LPVTLIGRLWYMQALAGSKYTAALDRTTTRDVKTVAPRGMIVDDAGRPLASNDSALVVSALSTELPKANIGTKEHPKKNPERVTEFARLSKILGVPADKLDAMATLCDYASYGPDAPKKNPGCWSGSPLQPIPLVSIDNGTPDGVQHASAVALQVLEQQDQFPGITAQIQDVRAYPAPQGASAAQLLGHVGKITGDDIKNAKTDAEKAALQTAAGAGGVIGQEGLEAEYNQYLQGKMGTRTVLVDPAGNPLQTLSETRPVPGDTLVTSIDARVQKIAEQALADAVNRARTVPQRLFSKSMTVPADAGAAVVLDLRTGHVIAAANYPTYDPGVWDGTGIDPKTYQALLKDPGKPLFSQAIQGQYAPGSTFKVISTAGAVSTPYYSLSGTYDCPSRYLGYQNFEGESGWGSISFAQALEISCDTYFYKIANTLWQNDGGVTPVAHPRDALINEAQLWGLGKDTGIDLPIDATGSIVTRQDKVDAWNKNHELWCAEASTEPNPTFRQYDIENCHDGKLYRQGDALNFAVGQGTVTVSPLQLAVAYGALGNGGTLFTPRIGKAIVGPDGKVVKKIDAPSRKLQVPADVVGYLQNALQSVVSQPHGTGYRAFLGFPLDQYTIAGKTGTAEVQNKIVTAWFASFGGPKGQPAQYAVVVMVSQGGQGGVTSAPAVRQIYDGIYGLDGSPASSGYNPHDMFAAAGPALPSGAPPAGLPDLSPAAVASASAPAPGSPSTEGSTAASPPAEPPRRAAAR
jgi:penicillin-binding protein 2